jgi:hypothetical protein
MDGPINQAVSQAAVGKRSCIIGPVGCSQVWFQSLAIQGTIWLPDKRISYDLPDGAPMSEANRDTIVMTFGREHANPDWRAGRFLVKRLGIDHA